MTRFVLGKAEARLRLEGATSLLTSSWVGFDAWGSDVANDIPDAGEVASHV